MPQIAAFRGLRYSRDIVPDLSEVFIPPYDVISPREQELYYDLNPYNVVRLELGRRTPRDDARDNPHTRAAKLLSEWKKNRVLIADPEPSVYYYELDYTLGPGTLSTRSGFIGALRLEDFQSGSVRPHERTFQAAKDERLGLMLECNANLSPVFALYSDPTDGIESVLRSAREKTPSISFADRSGMNHRIWRVTDREIIRTVNELIENKSIFIADGHHRYETAINFRDLQRKRHPDAGSRAAFEFVMMYLSNLNDGGLTILPTHRLLRHLGNWEPTALLKRAEEYFEVTRITGQVPEKWHAALRESRNGTVIGLFSRQLEGFHLLRARREVISLYLSSIGIPEVLQHLDVVVLDQVLLRNIMGLTDSFLANEENISFKHSFLDSIQEVGSCSYDAGFLINPTRIEQVQDVAEAKLTMPHKSTYFYPKVGSGLVINPLCPGEEIVL